MIGNMSRTGDIPSKLGHVQGATCFLQFICRFQLIRNRKDINWLLHDIEVLYSLIDNLMTMVIE